MNTRQTVKKISKSINSIGVGSTPLHDDERSPFALHEGEALLQVARTYPTIMDTILESVQNAIDENATRVWVTFNQVVGHLTIRDNGDGKDQRGFEEALVSVCKSVKNRGKMGQFGMGLISPYGKCERYTFTSIQKGADTGYIEWSFVTNELRSQAKIAGIPMRQLPHLRYVHSGERVRRGQEATFWRTQIRLENVTRDRIVSALDLARLKQAILDRFSAVMSKQDVVISLRIRMEGDKEEQCADVQAEPYSGRKLEETTINGDEAGDTFFRLYLARRSPKTKKAKGVVAIGRVSDDFRISFADFAKSTKEWLGKDVAEALASGIFEGEIITSEAMLHPSRKKFFEDERLIGFCIAIEQWFDRFGKTHYEAVEEEREEKRYQELGLKVLENLKNLFERPEFANLRDVLQRFTAGSTGRGHAPNDPDIENGELSGTALRGGTGKTPEKKQGNGRKREETKTPRENDSPLVVLNTKKARKRRVVQGDSRGLHIMYSWENAEQLYQLDMEQGVLIFNVLHPIFVRCERDDKALVRLAEYVAIQALTLESLPPEWRDTIEIGFDELLKPYSLAMHRG